MAQYSSLIVTLRAILELLPNHKGSEEVKQAMLAAATSLMVLLDHHLRAVERGGRRDEPAEEDSEPSGLGLNPKRSGTGVQLALDESSDVMNDALAV